MKNNKLLFVLFSVLITELSFSQSFEQVYPNEDHGAIVNINIHSSGVGYAVKECGSMLKTYDGGDTWNEELSLDKDANTYGFIEFVNDNSADEFVYYDRNDVYYSSNGFDTYTDVKPDGTTGINKGFGILNNGKWILYASSSIYISEDKGSSWNQIEHNDIDVSYFYTDGENIYTMFKDIYRSTDEGMTFTKVFESTEVLRKMVKFGDDFIISTTNKLFKSEDNGITWFDMQAVDYYGSSSTLQTTSNLLIANSSNRINYSEDGVNWTSIVMPKFIYRTASLFVDANDNIFVGGEAGQIYYTEDPDEPLNVIHGYLEELNDIVAIGEKVISVGLNGQIVYSEDKGNSWFAKKDGTYNFSTMDRIGDRIFSFNDNSYLVELSLDNMEFTNVQELPGDISNIVESKVTGNAFLFSNTITSFFFKSTDGGTTWTQGAEFIPRIYSLDITDEGVLFAVGEEGLIIKSTDDGDTWEQIPAPSEGINLVEGLFINEMEGMVISYNQLYKTVDGGQSYEAFQKPYNGLSLMKGADNKVYCLGVNGSDAWFYEVLDGGETNILIDESCSTLAREAYFDNTTNEIWFCGSGHTIEKMNLGSSSTADVSVIKNVATTPNPASDYIKLDLQNKSISSFVIYNSFGQEIGNGKLSEDNIDISQLNKGVYFILLQGENEVYSSQFIKM
jgi:photosystem II stability/assembly factor-like uncharacterized protein